MFGRHRAGLAVVGAITGHYFVCTWGLFLALFTLSVLRGGRGGATKQLRRQFEVSNRRDAEIEWRFTKLTIQIRDPYASADLKWGAFIKCVRTPAGLMLYTHPNIFHWLPRHAFAAESEFVALADLAQRQVAVHQALR